MSRKPDRIEEAGLLSLELTLWGASTRLKRTASIIVSTAELEISPPMKPWEIEAWGEQWISLRAPNA